MSTKTQRWLWAAFGFLVLLGFLVRLISAFGA